MRTLINLSASSSAPTVPIYCNDHLGEWLAAGHPALGLLCCMSFSCCSSAWHCWRCLLELSTSAVGVVFPLKGVLAPPTPVIIVHNVSTLDKNGFVPPKHKYQKCFLVTEVTEECRDGLSHGWGSGGRFLVGFQHFAYPHGSTMKKMKE